MAKQATQSSIFSPPGVLTKFRQECSIYESMPDAESSTDRLGWWKMHSSSFPILSRLARKVLCIPAASSKSERVFSVGGNTVSAKRGRLGPLTVQDLVMVACNLRLLREMELEDKEFALEDLVGERLNNNIEDGNEGECELMNISEDED